MNVSFRASTSALYLPLHVAGSHCVDPPTPPDSSKLKLSWVSTNPPAHDQTVLYKCDAGNSYNRFENDFNKWNYSLTCLQNNTFSTPSWPVCVDGDQ